jgi:hypothetical protein
METEAGGSVTGWIGHIKRGDHAAARTLWERYFDRLVRLARGKLAGVRGLAADEEDVALSAFDSLVAPIANDHSMSKSRECLENCCSRDQRIPGKGSYVQDIDYYQHRGHAASPRP